jgi:hypothetical protein
MQLWVKMVTVSLLTVFIFAFYAPARGAEDCHPITASEIESQWAGYRSLPGAKPKAADDWYECITIDRLYQVVCRTKPANPAHPSIIIRTLEKESDGSIDMNTEADTAAACGPFFRMMDDFKNLTGRLKKLFDGQQPI